MKILQNWVLFKEISNSLDKELTFGVRFDKRTSRVKFRSATNTLRKMLKQIKEDLLKLEKSEEPDS